ncbi:MAG TPA: hypothetical protein VFV10_05040 [Gammaproteobacteria bacterium]|nr:hypothetical protein [Gammaproteobacteria bacterium]
MLDGEVTEPWHISRRYQRVKSVNHMVHEDCEGENRNVIVDGHFALAPPPSPPPLPPPFQLHPAPESNATVESR